MCPFCEAFILCYTILANHFMPLQASSAGLLCHFAPSSFVLAFSVAFLPHALCFALAFSVALLPWALGFGGIHADTQTDTQTVLLMLYRLASHFMPL